MRLLEMSTDIVVKYINQELKIALLSININEISPLLLSITVTFFWFGLDKKSNYCKVAHKLLTNFIFFTFRNKKDVFTKHEVKFKNCKFKIYWKIREILQKELCDLKVTYLLTIFVRQTLCFLSVHLTNRMFLWNYFKVK